MNLKNEFKPIRDWAEEKGIYQEDGTIDTRHRVGWYTISS